MTKIQISSDLRKCFGTTREQGTRETCLAFATSDAHAARISPSWSPLSCEYLFYHSKKRDGTPPESGTTIEATIAALRHDGQPAEHEWPYLVTLPADKSLWKPPTSIGTIFFRDAIEPSTAFEEIWNSIESEVPVVIAMYLSIAFFNPDTDGVIDSFEPYDPALRHAVVATATGTRGTCRFILMRNSWGPTWGLSGYGWISEDYLAPRLFAAIQVQ